MDEVGARANTKNSLIVNHFDTPYIQYSKKICVPNIIDIIKIV